MKIRSQTRILVFGFLGLLLLLAYQIKVSYDTTLSQTAADADNLAQTIEGQLAATLRRIDASLHDIATRVPAAALQARAVVRYQKQINAILSPYKKEFPELRDIFVWDGEGNILYDTLRPLRLPQPGSIAQRPAFQYLKSHPEAAIAYSELVRGNVSGQLTVATYVPIRDSRGRLAGVVAASLNLTYFEEVFQRLQLSPGSVVFVRSSMDHKLVIRYPWIESEFNRAVRNPIQERIDEGAMGGRAEFRAVTDGERRLYGFRKIPGYPFYVVIGISEHGALRAWYRDAAYVVVIILLMTLALGLTLRRLNQIEAQREAARKEADAVLELLRDAIDSVPAGMIIYDEADRLVMYNQAQQKLFKHLSEMFRPGATFEDITREGLRRGAFPAAIGQEEAWLAMRLRQHLAADGQPYELELADGRWVQFSEHRTPKGYLVGSRIDITERKRLEAELREQASTDVLTGLPNRRHFLRRLEDELERVRRQTTREACVLMLDLDHFKRINDQYGHAAGDSLLRHFADLLRHELRTSDTVGRLGGEEFAVILPGSGVQAAQGFAQRVCDRLAQNPLRIAQEEIGMTVSIGIAALSADDLSADAALSRADKALYQAKEGGRNRVRLSDKPA